jgi:hypothetical protein
MAVRFALAAAASAACARCMVAYLLEKCLVQLVRARGVVQALCGSVAVHGCAAAAACWSKQSCWAGCFGCVQARLARG